MSRFGSYNYGTHYTRCGWNGLDWICSIYSGSLVKPIKNNLTFFFLLFFVICYYEISLFPGKPALILIQIYVYFQARYERVVKLEINFLNVWNYMLIGPLNRTRWICIKEELLDMDYIREFDIQLEREYYYAGETVCGNVILDTIENFKLRSKHLIHWFKK